VPAAAEPHGVGYLAPRDKPAVLGCAFRRSRVAGQAGVVHRLIADQVAQVGHHPVLGGLDEPIVVQLPDVIFDHIHLAGDDAEQGF
jgi:hypothetical protein